jgi:hypothetical protein
VNTYKILVRRHQRKRPLGRYRWEDNIKMDLMWYKSKDWTQVVQDKVGWWAFVKRAVNLRVLYKFGSSQLHAPASMPQYPLLSQHMPG